MYSNPPHVKPQGLLHDLSPRKQSRAGCAPCTTAYSGQPACSTWILFYGGCYCCVASGAADLEVTCFRTPLEAVPEQSSAFLGPQFSVMAASPHLSFPPHLSILPSRTATPEQHLVQHEATQRTVLMCFSHRTKDRRHGLLKCRVMGCLISVVLRHLADASLFARLASLCFLLPRLFVAPCLPSRHLALLLPPSSCTYFTYCPSPLPFLGNGGV